MMRTHRAFPLAILKVGSFYARDRQPAVPTFMKEDRRLDALAIDFEGRDTRQ